MEQGLAVLTEPISKTQLLQARLAIGLVVGLIVLGVAWYGLRHRKSRPTVEQTFLTGPAGR